MLPILLAITLQANSDPDQGKSPEPGWGLWERKADMTKAHFDSGFSNMELGGYMEFQAACMKATGLPDQQIDYWFRLSNSVNRIGTGRVEFGCWKDGRFLSTNESDAITTRISNVSCLRVNTPNKKSLIIRAEFGKNSRKLGTIKNGRTVKVDSFPATILERDGENWIYIVSPTKGWISDGQFTSSGNLRLCSKK